MNIKTKIVTALTLAVLVVPGISMAQTQSVAELQQEIVSLTAQLTQLEAQLAAAGGTTTTWCYTFNNNLSIGMSGNAVTELQTALQKDGESVTITGTFDDQTASAVTAFQEKYQSQILAPYGLSNGTGYVGTATRAQLNALFGCGNPPHICPAWGCNGPEPVPSSTPVTAAPTITSGLCTRVSTSYGNTFVDVDGGIITAGSQEYNVFGSAGITAGANDVMDLYAQPTPSSSAAYIVTAIAGSQSDTYLKTTSALVSAVQSSANPSNPTLNEGGVIESITSYAPGCPNYYSGSTTPISAVTVTSPSAGQSFSYGSTLNIQWTPASGGVAEIQLVSTSGGESPVIYSQIVFGDPINYSGSYSASLLGISPGSYYVRLMNPENDQIAAPNPPGAVIGQSGVFTVTAPSTATAAPYISRIDPVSTLTPGGAVTLDGQNFDSGSYVDLDGIQSINPGAYASTYFDFMLPSNVSVGSHTIWIGEKASGVTSNQVTMTISAAGCTSSSGYSSTNGEPCAPTATISQVQNLTATASGTSINLSWSAATATNGVMQYLIYRSTTPGFAPSESNRIAEGNTLLYADSNLSPDTYYYVVAAMDMQSNIGLASAQTSATVAGSSTITPSITILSPTSGGGTLTVGESIPYSVQVTTNKTVGAFGLLLTSVNKGWPGSPATYMSLTDSGGDVAVPTNGIYSGTATYPGKYGGSLPPGNYYLAAEWNIPDQTENLYTYSNFVYTIMTVSAPVAPILSQVQNLTATASGSSVNLSWSAATATNGVMQYLIYRSTTPGFTPSESNMIAEGNTLSYMDANLSPSTYYYVVAAMDMQSNLGAASAQASATIANTIIITPTPISPTPCKAPSLCPVPVVPIKLQTSASDTSDQTAIISQSLQSLLNQLSVLLKSL